MLGVLPAPFFSCMDVKVGHGEVRKNKEGSYEHDKENRKSMEKQADH